MYRNYKNIRVIAVNSENKTINNLYLDLSGQRHYLTALRMSAPLYGMLRKGIRMEDLTRWNGHSHVPKCPARYMRCGKLKHGVDHVIRIVDDYITYDLAELPDGSVA